MLLEYFYECILSILVENQPSMLTRIVGLLTRRGFNIESLAVGSTEYESLSRLVVVLPGNLRTIDQVSRQLYKLFSVVKVYNLTHVPCIKRELILLKILVTEIERQKVLEIANVFNANIVDCTNKTVTLEITGDSEKVVAVEQMLNKFGILEKIRTGKVGLSCESLVGGQIYTVSHDNLRRRMVNYHIREIEGKMYL